MSTENIFSTPIYSSRVEDYDNIQKELLDSIKNTEFEMNHNWGYTHYISDHSFAKNFIEENNLLYLKKEIHNHLKNYCNDFGFRSEELSEYKIYGSWASLFQTHNYGHIHNHGSADISGVYYYQTHPVEDDGKIFFVCPNPYMETSFCYKHLTSVWEYKPVQGQIILFPGWLSHGIETNMTSTNRISISFNIAFNKFSENWSN